MAGGVFSWVLLTTGGYARSRLVPDFRLLPQEREYLPVGELALQAVQPLRLLQLSFGLGRADPRAIGHLGDAGRQLLWGRVEPVQVGDPADQDHALDPELGVRPHLRPGAIDLGRIYLAGVSEDRLEI